MSEPQRGARLHNLDVLRGVAVLLVLWRHVPIRADLSLGGAELLVGRLYRIGWCGVDLFYVLSGFLISGLLFKELNRDGRLNLPRFWMRRGFKIWPSYFCAYGLLVLLTAAHALVRGDDARLQAVLQSILPNAVFVQNYFPEPWRWPNSWSLAVEEHFYLALPLLLAGLVVWGRRRGQTSPEQWFRTLPLLGAGIGVGVLALRLGWKRFHGGTWEQFYYATHMRADSLFFGVVLGCLQHYRPEWFGRLARLGPVWVLLALAALALPWCCSLTQDAVTYTVGFTALYLGFGGLVLLAGAYPTFGRDGPAGRLTRGLAWVGVYSYTIYLAHSIIYVLPGSWGLRRCVLFLVPGDGPLPAMWVDRALFFALSIGGGVLLSHAVERPFLRWRERWSVTASRAAATPNPPAGTPTPAMPQAA